MSKFVRNIGTMCLAAIILTAPFIRPTTNFGQQLSSEQKKKKVLEWGWDEPSTAFLRQNIDTMEQMPFDGLVFPLRYRDGTNITWKMWSSTKYEYSDLVHMVEDLTHTQFKTLTDRFIRVNVTPGDVDWFDDEGWAAIVHNFAVAAKVAKAGNCKGFMFDIEQYKTKLFNLAVVSAAHPASFEAYRAVVRQRGRELITAIGQEFPDIIILFPWAWSAYEANMKEYPLAPSFMDGILEAAGPGIRLVDAGEITYLDKTRVEFQRHYTWLKRDLSRRSAFPEKYLSRVETGFGIWMDAKWYTIGWHLDEFEKNYFTPDAFRTSVSAALETSDEYVWIYSENPDWWSKKNLPPDYVKALGQAKGRD